MLVGRGDIAAGVRLVSVIGVRVRGMRGCVGGEMRRGMRRGVHE